MGLEIKTEIIIEAPVEKVWDVFMDFPGREKWDDFFIGMKFDGPDKVNFSVEGTKIVGDVIVNEKNSEFRWAGVLGAPFVFRGEHYFIFQKEGKNKTRLTHGENFTGLALMFLKIRLQTSIPAAFARFNENLKKEIESR